MQKNNNSSSLLVYLFFFCRYKKRWAFTNGSGFQKSILIFSEAKKRVKIYVYVYDLQKILHYID